MTDAALSEDEKVVLGFLLYKSGKRKYYSGNCISWLLGFRGTCSERYENAFKSVAARYPFVKRREDYEQYYLDLPCLYESWLAAVNGAGAPETSDYAELLEAAGMI